MKILQLELWLKFKVCGREIGCARQTFSLAVRPAVLPAKYQVGIKSKILKVGEEYKGKPRNFHCSLL